MEEAIAAMMAPLQCPDVCKIPDSPRKRHLDEAGVKRNRKRESTTQRTSMVVQFETTHSLRVH